MRKSVPVALLLLPLVPASALGWGGDHPQGKLHRLANWSEKLVELINSDGRAHGHWVNQSDEFFYQGNTEALNRFVERAAALKNPSLVVTLHAGSTRRSRLWGQKPELPYDWKLLVKSVAWARPATLQTAEGAPAHAIEIDIWIDKQVELEKIKLPAEVRVISGGELEKFISNHAPIGSKHPENENK